MQKPIFLSILLIMAWGSFVHGESPQHEVLLGLQDRIAENSLSREEAITIAELCRDIPWDRVLCDNTVQPVYMDGLMVDMSTCLPPTQETLQAYIDRRPALWPILSALPDIELRDAFLKAYMLAYKMKRNEEIAHFFSYVAAGIGTVCVATAIVAYSFAHEYYKPPSLHLE